MKFIDIANTDLKAIIDDEDYEEVIKHSWSLGCGTGYAKCGINGRTVHLHRFVLGLSFGDKVVVDHKNGNKLDNRKENLRICSRKQNSQNRIKVLAKSGFKGVRKHGNRWQSVIKVDNKTVVIGSYEDKIEAAKAYDEAAIKYFGEFACTNKDLGLLKE